MQKIFLVDDSPLIQKRIAALLSGIPGARLVGKASDVNAAIRDILNTKPDLVLLDLCLQHGSGFDVLGTVHAQEPGIDIYMLSNFASEPYRRHAARLGAKGFFDKTRDIEQLRAVVARRALGEQAVTH